MELPGASVELQQRHHCFQEMCAEEEQGRVPGQEWGCTKTSPLKQGPHFVHPSSETAFVSGQ